MANHSLEPTRPQPATNSRLRGRAAQLNAVRRRRKCASRIGVAEPRSHSDSYGPARGETATVGSVLQFRCRVSPSPFA